MTLGGEEIFGIVAISLLFVCPLIGLVVYWVATSWRDVKLAEQAAALKKDMLDRGMSTEQIAAVLAAGLSEPRPSTDVILRMINDGYDSDDVTAVRIAIERLPEAGRADLLRAAEAMARNGYDGMAIAKFLESSSAAADTSPSAGLS